VIAGLAVLGVGAVIRVVVDRRRSSAPQVRVR
jgi:hypothetical protein